MGLTKQSRPWSKDLMDLYQTNFTSLVRCGQQLLDSIELAEEAVQEAFVRYHDSAASPAPGKELAYLRASVRNTACSMMRRRQLAAKHRQDHITNDVLDPDEIVILRDEGSYLHAAIGQLSNRQREVLEMRYWRHMSEQQMAIELDMSPGSIKVHSSRARARLRQELGHLVA